MFIIALWYEVKGVNIRSFLGLIGAWAYVILLVWFTPWEEKKCSLS